MEESKPNDASLISLIAQHEADAVSELYDRYNRLVFSVAFAIVGDRAVAEEITLDVFVHVWRGAGTYKPERAKVSTWLIAITRHHAIDILRGQNSRPESKSVSWDEISLPDGASNRDLEDSVDRSLEHQRVHEAVAQLPVDQRQALGLAYFKGYTHLQIAELLKQPLGTVKTRIRLGMQKLRHVLNKD
jgi:RNA polymerase sigma-70 factor (ECF subfamily)